MAESKAADKKLLLDNLGGFIRAIPFFRMVNAFREELIDVSYTELGWPRERIDFHEMRTALIRLGYRVSELRMSEDFPKRYWGNKGFEDYTYMIRIYLDRTAKTVEATNWYKLAFQCLHRNMNHVIYCYRFMEEYKKDSTPQHLEELFPGHWEVLRNILTGAYGKNPDGNAFRRKLLTKSGYWGTPLKNIKGILGDSYDVKCKIRPSDLWTYGIYWETRSRNGKNMSFKKRKIITPKTLHTLQK